MFLAALFLEVVKSPLASHRLFDPNQVKNIIWKFQVKSSQVTSKNLQIQVVIQLRPQVIRFEVIQLRSSRKWIWFPVFGASSLDKFIYTT